MRSCFIFLALFPALIPAAYGEDVPLKLKLDFTLNTAPKTSDTTPAFITAHQLEGKNGSQLEATGEAELRKDGRTISADRLLYQQDSKMVYADGSVRIEQEGSSMAGPHLEFDLKTGNGDMTQPTFHIAQNNSRGSADKMRIEGKQKLTLYNATYTTCPDGNDDWLLHIGELDLDNSTQIGVAHSSRVDFMGVPILYSPWMDFALNNGRKSGFLGPEFGTTVNSGTEITLPFYWNIAPNYDATISPRFMSKRGTLFNNEIRFMQPGLYDEIHLDVLPQDRLAQQSTRIHESLQHSQDLGHGFSDTLNLNRVSDDAYFRDLSTTVNDTSQVNLVREGTLNYNGGWWNATTRVQSYQTLQDPAAPVQLQAPYSRTPQILVTGQQLLDNKTNTFFTGEYVNFTHPTEVNGRRLVLYPSVSYPLVSDPAYYVTPKIGYHFTSYSLGQNNTSSITTAQRSLPIFSLDSGMTLERDFSMSGHDYVNTLEPRAYYVYIPYVNQDALPVFDTTLADFNFSQMFTENRFLGSDRIGDANQLTLAGTSRLLNADNGMEQFRIALGERFYFISPKVNLPQATLVTPATTTDKSDILLEISGRLSRKFSLDGLWQYNPTQSTSEMYGTSLQYLPEAGKVFNLGYLYRRNTLRQVDMSEQWPLYGRWHSVARWAYSLQEKRLLEGLAGLEYNQACWTARVIAQVFTTATQQVSTGVFVQLDMTGLVGVGSDPLDTLRHSIPGYSKLNQSSPDDTLQGLQ